MSSLTNQQANTKSLTGLSDTYSTNIVCDTFECIQEFTIDPGCVINLPANSIPDPALSTNVAFRNQNNTFSLTNIFSSIVQFTSTTIPVITQSIPANDATTNIPTTSWTDTYFGKKTLATGGTTQSWFGVNRFTSNGANLPITLQNTDQPTYFGGLFIANTNGSYNANTLLGDTVLLSTGTGQNTGALSLTTWSSTECGIRIGSSNIAYNGTNHNFNGNVNLPFPSSINILNSGSARGMQIQNDNTNGGLTLFRGVGNSTRFNFFSNNASGVATNNFYITNGDTCYLQGASGLGIGMVGSAISLDGICSFTNTTTPVITQAISLADNSTKIATTAFVKGQNYITSAALTPYALLAPTSLQTFAGTAENTFNNRVNINDDLRFVDTFSSKISQQGNALVIENISNVNSVQIRSTTSGLVQRTGLLIENGITCTLQGGSGNTITLTGLNTPTLGIPPLAGVYSSEIATTSWVNTELVGNYALLNPAALQIWGTNENQFNTQVTMNVVGTRYLNGANSSSITQTGNNLILANIANSNSIQLRTNTAGGVFSQNVLARNGNEIAIKGDTGIVRILNTACTIECGTFSSEAPYNCGYLTIGAPITSKTNYNIGFINTIPGASLNSGWATAVVAYNIFTIVWNGTGDYTLGVWLCDIVIVTNCTTAQNFSLCWNTISNTSMDITEKCAQSTVATQFNATGHQITRLSFVLNITNLLQTFWLNSFKVGGAGLSSNTAYSQIKFTRIA